MKTTNHKYHESPKVKKAITPSHEKGRHVFSFLCCTIIGMISLCTAHAGINLGDASPYTILYGGSDLLSFNSSSAIGNIGVGKGASVSLNPTSSVEGRIDFAGSTNISGEKLVTGSINGDVSEVYSALTYISLLSSEKSALKGNDISIRLPGDQTIYAIDGQKTGDDYVFNVTDFKFEGGKLLTIDGGNFGGNVVFNFDSFKKVNFNGTIILTGGLFADNILWNFYGEDTQLGNKGNADLKGIFLNPKGTISFGGNAELCGRLFGGSGDDMKIIGNSHIEICECPEPATYILMGLGALLFLISYNRRRAE
jgi:choice-of-anchor A domain-containing protein